MNIGRALLVTVLFLFVYAAGQLHAADGTILTWHNNNDRTGVNNSEKILTPANVNAQTFGLLAKFHTDGKVDAQPLYVPNLTIAGHVRNVLFVASEHGSVYALNALTGNWLWKVSLLKAGETTPSFGNCNQITPEIGVTSTPVIDLTKGPNGAIYVVNMAKDSSGNYHQRINALDITTGEQLFGGPTEVVAAYPGTGDNSTNGTVVFDPKQYAERAGLLEWNGGIYTAWTSHCDNRPYTGWIMGYDASTLKQTSVLNLTPNGSEGGIWMSQAGLAAGDTKIYFLDGNGTFDTTLDANGFPVNQDYGNAFIALYNHGGTLKVSDYYATDTTVQQSKADIDLGSGGLVLLDVNDNSGNQHMLAVGAGKDHNIYVVDRNNFGKYHPNGGFIYQMLPNALPSGAWSSPAYFDNKVYYGANGDSMKAFAVSNALLGTTPVSHSANTFNYPGATPSVSALGTTNGIVWAVNNGSSNATLYAYNAEDVSQELYDSNQSGTRDQFGPVDHFVTPTIANGRVYVPTQTGIAVFGLLPQ